MSDAEANERRRDPRHILRYVARSDRGLVRATNQDSVFAGNRLLVIADGMGGHAAGDTASRLVVAAFAPLNDRRPAADLLSDLVSATREGNEAIAEVVDENPDLDGMGTTVTAMLFDGNRVGMAHVGDSRAYLYRTGVLHQLTHDDTFVQSLVDDGRITEDEAAHHPQRNLLLRALNGTDLDPALALREVRAGDRYLLCSDGLSGVVGAEQIADTLADPDPERAADVLIQRALLRGGPDNVTVIVADVVDTGAAPIPGPVMVQGADDPDATGPIQQMTREMPRVPLPPIPEAPGVPAVFVSDDEDDDDLDELDDPDAADEADGARGGDADPDDDAGGDDEDDNDGGDGHRGSAPRAGAAAAAAADGATRDIKSETTASAASASRAGPSPTRPRWHRRGALTVAILALIAVALAGSTLWVRSQYYVGAQNNLVAVFRGVDGSLLGVQFSSFQETSCENRTDCMPIKVSDLQPAARNLVLAGIQAASLSDARNVIDRLSGQLLPPCPVPDAPGSTGASSIGPSGIAPPGTTPVSDAGTTGSTAGTAPGTAGAPAGTGAGAIGRTSPAGRTSAAPATTTSGRTGVATATTTPAAHIADAPSRRTAPATTGTGAHRPAGAHAAAPSTVTVNPAPTTLTVLTTITAGPAGLLGAVLGQAFQPQAATTRPPAGHTATATTGARATTSATRAKTTVTAATPIVTVTQTVTAGPTVTATPLAPAPAVPGVNCRVTG